MVQRSSASRFCAECRSHIRRDRRQPRYHEERMPAIVAPSTTEEALVVGAGVVCQPRYPTRRRHLRAIPQFSRLPLALASSFLRHIPPAASSTYRLPCRHTPATTLRAQPCSLSFSPPRQPPPAAVSIGPVVPRQSAAVASHPNTAHRRLLHLHRHLHLPSFSRPFTSFFVAPMIQITKRNSTFHTPRHATAR